MHASNLASIVLAAALLPAQSPCLAPDHLATQEPFRTTHYFSAPGNNGLNLPPGYRGAIVFADLTADTNLTISQIDIRLNDDGMIPGNWDPAPGLVGQRVIVQVYSTPTTWTGTWPTPTGPVLKSLIPPGPGSPWTPVATGTLTIQTHRQHSPIVFPTPFTVPANTPTGYAIELGPVTTPVPSLTPLLPPPYALHPSLLVLPFAPGSPRNRSDQFLQIDNSDISNQAFVVAPNAAPKTPILDFHYTIPSTSAFFTPFGQGCYDEPQAFYELFPPSTPTSFDLSGLGLRLTQVGNVYVVTTCPGTIAPLTPTAVLLPDVNTGLPLVANGRSIPMPLGFTFPYPGGSTTSIVVTTNGNIFLDQTLTDSQCTNCESLGVAGFLMGQPQLAPLWAAFDPAPAGGVYFDLNLTSNPPVACVTWTNVEEANQPGSSNTFQVVLDGNGQVEYRYGACALVATHALVGFTSGWTGHDPGMRDLSATTTFLTGDGTLPPELGMDARPILGTTPNLTVRDVPANTFCFHVLGLPQQPPVPLDQVGMPGCQLQVAPLLLQVFPANGTVGTLPLVVPNIPSLLLTQWVGQAAVMSPGSNAAGLTVSNPLCIRIGLH